MGFSQTNMSKLLGKIYLITNNMSCGNVLPAFYLHEYLDMCWYCIISRRLYCTVPVCSVRSHEKCRISGFMPKYMEVHLMNIFPHFSLPGYTLDLTNIEVVISSTVTSLQKAFFIVASAPSACLTLRDFPHVAFLCFLLDVNKQAGWIGTSDTSIFYLLSFTRWFTLEYSQSELSCNWGPWKGFWLHKKKIVILLKYKWDQQSYCNQ